MVLWLYIVLLLSAPPLLYGLLLAVAYLWVRWKYPGCVLRISPFCDSDHR